MPYGCWEELPLILHNASSRFLLSSPDPSWIISMTEWVVNIFEDTIYQAGYRRLLWIPVAVRCDVRYLGLSEVLVHSEERVAGDAKCVMDYIDRL